MLKAKGAVVLPDKGADRVEATLPFVSQIARAVAATMPHAVDLQDLVQDGVIGLIDANKRFDPTRGIKFETFAQRRIRGAMLDALRKEAWPRGVRRDRRVIEAAQEAHRREFQSEPSLQELAVRLDARIGTLSRRIVHIQAIEATARTAETPKVAALPAELVPRQVEAPDESLERVEISRRLLEAIAKLPRREQKLIDLYYFSDATMKQIGAKLGVNESRISQLHAKAIRQLRANLAADAHPLSAFAKEIMRKLLIVKRTPKRQLSAKEARRTSRRTLWHSTDSVEVSR